MFIINLVFYVISLFNKINSLKCQVPYSLPFAVTDDDDDDDMELD
jgi:hypothetical protein